MYERLLPAYPLIDGFDKNLVFWDLINEGDVGVSDCLVCSHKHFFYLTAWARGDLKS
jgi:hypothetical protein